MEKLSITLTSTQKAFIDAQVASGRYASTSELLRDTISQRIKEQEFLDLLIERHDAAMEEYESGTLLSHEEVFGELRTRRKDPA